MSTYVMGDIHGCYDELVQMMKVIDFKDSDRLILVGDYIDRGRQNYEMLQFIGNCPENILLLRGNHEEEFIAYVELMQAVDKADRMTADYCLSGDTMVLYDKVRYRFGNDKKGMFGRYFDVYETIKNLIENNGVVMKDLISWANLMKQMPYWTRLECNGKKIVVTHAGYWEDLPEKDLEHFCLYAREEGIKSGGIENGIVISGHTPTILEDEYAYTGGRVFRHENKAGKCVFYNIDCGCVFRDMYPSARLACIRIEDEEVFYV